MNTYHSLAALTLTAALSACSGPQSKGSDAGESGKGGAGPQGSGGSPGNGSGGGQQTAGASSTDNPCGLESPAFCEDFETPHPGGRGGDLDEALWSMARFSVANTRVFTRYPSSSAVPAEVRNTPTFCGAEFSDILPPGDVKICPGTSGGATSNQLHELVTDGGSFALNSMRIRQPFDFTGRTGTLTFEVDAKINTNFDGHGWWTEIWITRESGPIPYHGAPTVGSYPSEAIGFQIAPVDAACFEDSECNQVGRILMSKDFDLTHDFGIQPSRMFKTADGKTNRFRMLINTNSVEFWVADFDNPTVFNRAVTINDLDLGFSVGYVHLQHAQYNAQKMQASATQAFRWDNIGFDGPIVRTPRAYDAPEPGADSISYELGYAVPLETENSPAGVTVPGVDPSNATKAILNLNIHASRSCSLRYRLNGNDWHTFTTPAAFEVGVLLRTFALEVPVAELIAGDNLIEFDQPSQPSPVEYVGNIDLSVESAL